MAHIMVAVMPFAGHLASVLPVVAELVRGGHQVRVYTGAAYEGDVQAVGAEWLGWRHAPDFDENNLPATFPALVGHKGPRQTMANLEHLFIRTGSGQHTDLMAAWTERPWDVLVADSLSTGAVLAAESTGCAWASLSVTPLALPSRHLPPQGLALRPGHGVAGHVRDSLLRGLSRLLTMPLHRAYNQVRADAGLPPSRERLDTAWFSPMLVCVFGTRELDYPRPDLPSHVPYVGMVHKLAQEPWEPPSWWAAALADPRPLVHITQGTQDVDPADLLLPALAALAPLDVQTVAVTGVRGRATLGVPVPANARVADFLPYGMLLPHVRLMVTNGGWGGVLAALSHGIPLIVAGGDIDKPEIAARVAYAGVGIDLRTGTPSSGQVRSAVTAIMANPEFAARAGAVAAGLNELAAPAEIRRLVEELAPAEGP